jgi:hypothetical protein
MELIVSGELHAPTVNLPPPLTKEFPIPNREESFWVPEPVWIQQHKNLMPSRKFTSDI